MMFFSPNDATNALVERMEVRFKKPCSQWGAMEINAFIREKERQEEINDNDNKN